MRTFENKENIIRKKSSSILKKEDAKKSTPFFQPIIQAKLKVGEANDKYEKEADSVANKVVSEKAKPQLKQEEAPLTIQKKCTNCEEEKKVQKKENKETKQPKQEANSLIQEVLQAPGRQLDKEVRRYMEPRFGYSFEHVKIHTDFKAAQSANAINAKAYTSGNNVVFASGKYNPNSTNGKKLIAHELTHVLQQGKRKKVGQKTIQRTSISKTNSDKEIQKKCAEEEDPETHTVVSGDTLTKIAKQYCLHYLDIARWNKIADINKIEVGQKLLLRDPYQSKFEKYNPPKQSMGWPSRIGKDPDAPTQTTASNGAEVGLASVSDYDIVYLTGAILEKIKLDPDMQKHQRMVVEKVISDPRFKKENYVYYGKESVGFGGKRWSSKSEDWSDIGRKNPALHLSTWMVGANELTWVLRNATVFYKATVMSNGLLILEFHLVDRLDLSPSAGRSEAYNNISSVLGFGYHGVAGGNINMQIRAVWPMIIVK